MARIKTALEIALERASTIQVDPAKIALMELEKKAGIIAHELLENPASKLDNLLTDIGKEHRSELINMMQNLLLRHISLVPVVNEMLMDNVFSALRRIKEKPGKVDPIYQSILQHLTSYGDQLKRYYENLKNQFSDQMDQMSAQMSQQMGMPVDIDPAQHPEFQKVWGQIKGQIDGQFGAHLENLVENLRSLKNLY